MADYQATTTATTPVGAEDPGKTLGIVGLVLAIVAPVIGIIVSAIARSQSKNAGFDNKMAKIGIIVGIVLTVLYIVGAIIYVAVFASLMQSGQYTG